MCTSVCIKYLTISDVNLYVRMAIITPMITEAMNVDEKDRLTLFLSLFPNDFEMDMDAPVPSNTIIAEKRVRTGITILMAVNALEPISQLTISASLVVTRWPEIAIITDPFK